MKLTLAKRTGSTKGEIKKIRREGNIPAVLYGSGSSVEKVFVKGDEFNAILRNLKQGLLPTTLFDLELEGKKYQAVIKDIHYNAATYAVEHIDLFQIVKDKPVSINVPIQLQGIAECAGIKLGGTLRQVIRSLKVACLPHQIPSEFYIDVRELNIAQSKRLSDISIPSNVKPLARMNEVAVVVAK